SRARRSRAVSIAISMPPGRPFLLVVLVEVLVDREPGPGENADDSADQHEDRRDAEAHGQGSECAGAAAVIAEITEAAGEGGKGHEGAEAAPAIAAIAAPAAAAVAAVIVAVHVQGAVFVASQRVEHGGRRVLALVGVGFEDAQDVLAVIVV